MEDIQIGLEDEDEDFSKPGLEGGSAAPTGSAVGQGCHKNNPCPSDEYFCDFNKGWSGKCQLCYDTVDTFDSAKEDCNANVSNKNGKNDCFNVCSQWGVISGMTPTESNGDSAISGSDSDGDSGMSPSESDGDSGMSASDSDGDSGISPSDNADDSGWVSTWMDDIQIGIEDADEDFSKPGLEGG